jgi:hypothetical protein
MDGRGGATQEAKAESNAGASAEDAKERPWRSAGDLLLQSRHFRRPWRSV